MTTPWWLGGEEQCEVCLQVYVLEMEVRCVDCDGPHCPHCSVAWRERGLRGCAGCGSEEEVDGGSEEEA
ncbi:hypothetical protein BH23GEM11_BH23GEM11_00460 [soil metagenome]